MFKITVAAFAVSEFARGLNPNQKNYFEGEDYQAKSADDKMDDLWMMCQKQFDSEWGVPFEHAGALFQQRAQTTFYRKADEMDPRWVKVQHAQGVVGRVDWEDLGNHAYTGLFEGYEGALIRLSESNFAVKEASGLSPSFAIKFTRDGLESVNLFGSVGFEASDSWNFFKYDFSNHVDFHQVEECRETVMSFFTQGLPAIKGMGLGEFARYMRDGTLLADYMMPFRLDYVPSEDVRALFKNRRPSGEADFRDQLAAIPNGTVLFEVHALSQPESFDNSIKQHIANIRMTTDLIKSEFGDVRLFFQHESLRHDFAYFKDEWREFHPRIEKLPEEEQPGNLYAQVIADFPTDRKAAEEIVRASIDNYKCPFAFLLE